MILASRTVLLNKDSVQSGYVLPSLGRSEVKQSRYVRPTLPRSKVWRSQTDGEGPPGNSRKEEYILESLSWQGVEDTSVSPLITGMARIAARSRGKLVVVVPPELPAKKHTQERGYKVNIFLVQLTANVHSK